jgi:hypothetical protein
LERFEGVKIEGTRTIAENACSPDASDLVEKGVAAEEALRTKREIGNTYTKL